MKQENIPIYIDPTDFETNISIKYPCSTNRMRYSALTHRYYLEPEALVDFGVQPFLGGSDSHNKLQRIINEVTDDVYGAILHLAPFNYKYMCYLIAQSRSVHFPDRYTARKQFESALLYQAMYKVDNADVRDISGINIETGKIIDRSALRKELRHMSPKTLDIMQGLGLFFNGHIRDKHLINYSEVM